MSDLRYVRTYRVTIEPMATMGRGYGFDVETDEHVEFAMDHRPAKWLGEEVQSCGRLGEPAPVAEVSRWSVFDVRPATADERETLLPLLAGRQEAA